MLCTGEKITNVHLSAKYKSLMKYTHSTKHKLCVNSLFFLENAACCPTEIKNIYY